MHKAVRNDGSPNLDDRWLGTYVVAVDLEAGKCPRRVGTGVLTGVPVPYGLQGHLELLCVRRDFRRGGQERD